MIWYGNGFWPVGLWILTSLAMLLVWGLVIWATVGVLGRYESRVTKDAPHECHSPRSHAEDGTTALDPVGRPRDSTREPHHLQAL